MSELDQSLRCSRDGSRVPYAPYCTNCGENFDLTKTPQRSRLYLADLVEEVHKAARGDSNDEEIEALQEALKEALRQLGREDLL